MRNFIESLRHPPSEHYFEWGRTNSVVSAHYGKGSSIEKAGCFAKDAAAVGTVGSVRWRGAERGGWLDVFKNQEELDKRLGALDAALLMLTIDAIWVKFSSFFLWRM